jgi:hypothetical protein
MYFIALEALAAEANSVMTDLDCFWVDPDSRSTPLGAARNTICSVVDKHEQHRITWFERWQRILDRSRRILCGQKHGRVESRPLDSL